MKPSSVHHRFILSVSTVHLHSIRFSAASAIRAWTRFHQVPGTGADRISRDLAALRFLKLDDLVEQLYVLDGQSQDLVLAELLIRGMGWNELAKFGEGTVHVLLPPSLAAVREDTANDLADGSLTRRCDPRRSPSGQTRQIPSSLMS